MSWHDGRGKMLGVNGAASANYPSGLLYIGLVPGLVATTLGAMMSAKAGIFKRRLAAACLKN